MKALPQQGFTLIELMVSLSIGLLLVAVVTQLFLSGQVNYQIQQAAATVQDSGVFGLNTVTKNIRLANHGNASQMNDQTRYGGVVLSAHDFSSTDDDSLRLNGNLNGLLINNQPITSDAYISKNAATESAFDALKSDQLVVIYQAPKDMRTCTGREVRGPTRSLMQFTKGWYVIEKYYIKKEAKQSHLYCADSVFIAEGEVVPQNFELNNGEIVTLSESNHLLGDYGSEDAGQILAKNVEYMRIQLLVRHVDQTTMTLSLDEYQTLPSTVDQTRPAVIGINLAWLVRSDEKVPNNKRDLYQVLDQSIKVPDDKFMRHLYSTTVALRNGGLGEVTP